jgi:hypothetical protein
VKLTTREDTYCSVQPTRLGWEYGHKKQIRNVGILLGNGSDSPLMATDYRCDKEGNGGVDRVNS